MKHAPRNSNYRAHVGHLLGKTLLATLLWISSAGLLLAQDKVFVFDIDFDSLGRLREITHPGSGMLQTYSHTTSGNHDTVTYDGETIVSNTTYNQGNAPTRTDIANFGGIGAGIVDNTYDTLNRLKSLKVRLNGTTHYQSSNLIYNSWGYLQSLQRNDPATSRTFSYTYGSHGQLTRMTISGNGSVDYGYDTKGNLTARDNLNTSEFSLPGLSSISFDNKNQRSVWNYDADGKLTGDDDFEYIYNNIEHLECVVDPASGWDRTHYLYDGSGERVREVVDDQVVYSIRVGGMLVSQEFHRTRMDGNMDVTRKDYVYHNGQVILTVTHHPDATVTRQYQYRDRMGHPAVVVDEEDGFNARYYEYSPFGIEMRNELTGITTHEYTGHERDEATGLDYMHARYCSSYFARFNSPDPAFDFNPVNPFAYNLYAYTRNNPVNAWDPYGLDTTGTVIEDQIMYHADQGNHIRGFGFTMLKVAWDIFGMESVSVVADKGIKGQKVTLGEAGEAIFDVATMGKGKNAKAAVSGSVQAASAAGDLGRKGFRIIKEPSKARFIVDQAGRTLDLKMFRNLKRVPGKVNVGRNGGKMVMKGGPKNAIVRTTGGHALIYDGSGRLIMDISPKRIKVIEWHKAPNGQYFPKRGSSTKFNGGAEGSVPEELLKEVGLK